MRAFTVALVWTLALTLAWKVWRKHSFPGLRNAGRTASWQGAQLFVRAPLAMLTAAFVAEILPPQAISAVLGGETGLLGIALGALIGALIGAVMPGGPLISFPVVLLLLDGGAGLPQTIAFLTSWSIVAFQHLFAYEIPLMGWRFAALRLVASAALPVVSGILAALLLAIWPSVPSPP